jgi:hypothetical protein
MMNIGLLLFAITITSSLFIVGITPDVQAQTTVDVAQTTPCFMNYTASTAMWENCGFEEDFIKATLMPFEWVMGGYFTLVIVALLVIITYMKYQTAIYPLAIGIVMLPISYFAFPEMVLGYVAIAAAVGIGGVVHTILFKQTKD